MYYNNKKLFLSILWVCAGAALIILSTMRKIDGTIWSGTGGALCTVGIAQIIKNVKYRKDVAYKEKVDIELSDERNHYIRLKAMYVAGYIFVIASGVMSIILLTMGYKEYGSVLSGALCFVLATYWISYMIYKHNC